jgi:SAM-dependent methyltransferase
MNQDFTEYLDPNSSNPNWVDKNFLKYHEGQWENPKFSTVALLKFLDSELSASRKIVDLACGAGAATAHIATQHPHCTFLGIDHSPKLIETAKREIKSRGMQNLEFFEGDILNLDQNFGTVDGVTCIQTVSWMADFRPLVSELITKISPTWFAITGLFYPGNITARVEISEHDRGTKTFFNVYALPEIANFVDSYGFEIQGYEPFEINSDLPKPDDINIMQTYTERIENKQGLKRIQISGPILINSGFLKLVRR